MDTLVDWRPVLTGVAMEKVWASAVAATERAMTAFPNILTERQAQVFGRKDGMCVDDQQEMKGDRGVD